MPRNTLEQKLQKECIRIFHLFKPKEYGRLYMNHQNPKNAKNGRELNQMGLVPGIADLTYLSDNGIIFIELKVEKNKQTKSQVFWQNLVQDLGYTYVVVKSINEFCAVVKIKI